jgi:hypothetical protein
VRRKIPAENRRGFIEPRLSLYRGAGDYNAKHLPVKVFYPAKAEAKADDAFFHRVSSGSPKTFNSLSAGVFEVLNTTAAFAFSSPTGTLSPPWPAAN